MSVLSRHTRGPRLAGTLAWLSCGGKAEQGCARTTARRNTRQVVVVIAITSGVSRSIWWEQSKLLVVICNMCNAREYLFPLC